MCQLIGWPGAQGGCETVDRSCIDIQPCRVAKCIRLVISSPIKARIGLFSSPGVKSGFWITGVKGDGLGERPFVESVWIRTAIVAPIVGCFFNPRWYLWATQGSTDKTIGEARCSTCTQGLVCGKVHHDTTLDKCITHWYEVKSGKPIPPLDLGITNNE